MKGLRDRLSPDTLKQAFGALELLYEKMDRAYDESAGVFNFTCIGCRDNCCSQLFHHHTVVEFLYLQEGLLTASSALRQEISSLAGLHEPSLICPVNGEGLCRLYEHRPMICRLHGLPHFFTRPDGQQIGGGGCEPFVDSNPGWQEKGFAIDRTSFYTELASIERLVRLDCGYRERVKLTTAEMLRLMDTG